MTMLPPCLGVKRVDGVSFFGTTFDMTAAAIREVMQRSQPFLLKASDGSEYRVAHPDFISVGQGDGGLVVVHTAEGIAILDLFSITAMEIAHASDASPETQ